MADRVLLSASSRNLSACIELALAHDLGIEVMAFAYPDVLDGDWRHLLADYQQQLKPVRAAGAPITLHGPFMDLPPGSPDARINAVCAERFEQTIAISAALGAEKLVLHANFIGAIRTEEYRRGWHQRSLSFWRPIGDAAAAHGITIALENMWEFDPAILSDLLADLDHPALRACLDVGHAHLFSDVPFSAWLTALQPFLIHTHMNNNDGRLDVHRAFPDGVLDYGALLPLIRALPHPPTMTLEMETTDDMMRSLEFFAR